MNHLSAFKEYVRANPKKVAAGSVFLVFCLWANRTQYHNILLAKWLFRIEEESGKRYQAQQDEIKQLQIQMKKLSDFFASYHLNQLAIHSDIVMSSSSNSFHSKLLKFVILEPVLQFYHFGFQVNLLRHEESLKAIPSGFMQVPEVLSELFGESVQALLKTFDGLVGFKFKEIFVGNVTGNVPVEKHLKDVISFLSQLVPYEKSLNEILNFSKDLVAEKIILEQQECRMKKIKRKAGEAIGDFLRNLGLKQGKVYVEPRLMQITLELMRGFEGVSWMKGDKKAFGQKIQEIWDQKYGQKQFISGYMEKVKEICMEIMTSTLDLFTCADGQIIAREMVYASGKRFVNRVMIAEKDNLFAGKPSESAKMDVYTRILESGFILAESFAQNQELYNKKIKEMIAIGKKLESFAEEEKREEDEDARKLLKVKLNEKERTNIVLILNVYKEFQMEKQIQISLQELARKIYLGAFFEKYFLPKVLSANPLAEMASENLENLLEAFA